MNDNWTVERQTPRPIVVRKDTYRIWPITPTGVSGEGAETAYSSFIDIPEPYPAGAGLFSVPNMAIETDHGGELSATVEFWGAGEEEDDDGLLSETGLTTFSAMAVPITLTSYGLLSDAYAWNPMGGTGMYYSAWVTVNIPAGSGFLIGETGEYGVGGNGTIQGKNSFSASGSIELGDANGSVVGSFPLCSFSTGSGESADTATLTQTAATNCAVSWPEIKKVRVAMNVTGCGADGYGTFSVVQISLMGVS